MSLKETCNKQIKHKRQKRKYIFVCRVGDSLIVGLVVGCELMLLDLPAELS